jgi:cyclopropane-fatty-acyl-phospholipid synthase
VIGTMVDAVARRLVLRAFGRMRAGSLELMLADGTHVIVGTPGATPAARLRVLDARFFRRCVLYGDVGFGESYVAGEWETDSLFAVISWAIANLERVPAASGSRIGRGVTNVLGTLNQWRHRLRPNTLRTSKRNIREHYDLGNEFYQLWLDATMTYSSALFNNVAQSLESAQSAKYEALAQKLRLAPTDHVLEIGSGWGGFAVHAATQYGCRVTTVTISEAQYAFARERIARLGLSDRVDVLLADYRTLTGQYDKIASIEMMEAIGDKFLETYFAKINALLKPEGIVGLQYITVPDVRHAALRRNVDWIQRHIFPGSLLLSIGRVNQALHRTGDLFLHDLEDLGTSYARTLHLWWKRFNSRLGEVRALGFDDAFIRKWNYYLQYCEAAFTQRNVSVVQAIYTRPNNRSLHRAF